MTFLMKKMKSKKTIIAAIIAYIAGIATVLGIHKYIQKLKRDELLGYIKDLEELKNDDSEIFGVEFEDDLDDEFDEDLD